MLVDYYGELKTLNKNIKIRPHFELQELANNCGLTTIPQFIIDKRSETFLDMLEEFRCWFAKPMALSCCYRQPIWNKKVGGDVSSAHLHACACDWNIRDHNETQRRHVRDKWAEICKAHGVIGAVNFYTGGYHLEAFTDVWYGNKTFQVRDYRGTKSDWK